MVTLTYELSGERQSTRNLMKHLIEIRNIIKKLDIQLQNYVVIKRMGTYDRYKLPDIVIGKREYGSLKPYIEVGGLLGFCIAIRSITYLKPSIRENLKDEIDKYAENYPKFFKIGC